MSIKYKNRFKTKEEFIKEYGEDWRRICDPRIIFLESMDILLGKDFDFEFLENEEFVPYRVDVDTYWYVSKKFITKYQVSPDYSPKQFSRQI